MDATVEQKEADSADREDSITEELENVGQRNTASEKASAAEAVDEVNEPKSEAKR